MLRIFRCSFVCCFLHHFNVVISIYFSLFLCVWFGFTFFLRFSEWAVNVASHWNQLCNTCHFRDSWLNVAENAVLADSNVADDNWLHLWHLHFHLVDSMPLYWRFYSMKINVPFHWANDADYSIVVSLVDQNRKSESIDAVALWIVYTIYEICNGIRLPIVWIPSNWMDENAHKKQTERERKKRCKKEIIIIFIDSLLKIYGNILYLQWHEYLQ